MTDQGADKSPEQDPVRTGDWFRQAFDEFYVQLYAHRGQDEAARLIHMLRSRFRLHGRVLEVACGPGRFLRELRREGDEVLGVDLSAALLRQARITLGMEPPPLLRADMRALPVRSDACSWALLLFTSFGYFDHIAEDQGVLRELGRVLAPGGSLVLDFLNAGKVARELVPESRRTVSGREVRETRWCDPTGPFLRKRVQVRAGGAGLPEMAYEERVRLYTPMELIAHLKGVGLEIRAVLGDYDGGGFSESDSPRCLLVASKREV